MRLTFFYSLALCLTTGVPAVAQSHLYGQPTSLPYDELAAAPRDAYREASPTPTYSPAPSYALSNAAAPPAQTEATCAANDVNATACLDGHCNCDRWFGSIAGLYMTRDNPNAFWTTYETNNNPNQVMNTRNANDDWGGGAELRLGRWIDCGIFSSRDSCARNGVEVVYFFVSPLNGFSSVLGSDYPAGTVSTTIDLQDPTTVSGNVEIGGQDSAIFFDGAAEQRIWRHDEVQNLELNLLHQRLGDDVMQVTWLAGLRYFRFDGHLTYGSVQDGFNFGDNGGANEAYLAIRSVNNLLGPQVGARVDYQAFSRLGLFADAKLGIYGNQVNTRAHLHTGDGLEGYDIYGNASTFSVLAQFDLGVNYQVASNWRAFLGYRLLAVSGIALADNEFPHYLAATDELAQPDTNGNLILHGALGGLEYKY